MDWNPIETAPRNGDVVLLTAGGKVYAAYWNLAPKAFGADKKYPWTLLDETNGLNGWEDGKYGPTHWAPLPTPPTPADPA